MKAPETIYKTTRDNSAYDLLHEKQWYGSDEAFYLKQDKYQMWYENELGEKVLINNVTKEWSKTDIIKWYYSIFENDNSFRE